jgi:PIN domain nuclease of toxin-antitoxin system
VILLDTHVVVWMLARPARLSRRARRAIEKASSGGLAIASVTLFELSLLAAAGDIRVKRPPSEWLRSVVREARLSILEITPDVAAVAGHLPPSFPADPFDRLVVATAIVGDLPLVTADERIHASGVVETVW